MMNADAFDTFSDIFSREPRPSSIESEDQAMIKRLVGYLSEWYPVNPVVFGSILQSILSKGKSCRNITENPLKTLGRRKKYINEIQSILSPIFTNELWSNIEEIKSLPNDSKKVEAAKEYHEKLSRMEFLDPKCEGGSCLVELYTEIRDAEDYLISVEGHCIDLESDIKINPGNFYGLDSSQSNVNIAIVMFYIAEEQAMNKSYNRFKSLCSLPDFKPFTTPLHIEKIQVDNKSTESFSISLKGIKIIDHPMLSKIPDLR